MSALKIIEPEEVTRERPNSSKPVPRSDSLLLQKLKQGEVPYAHCAWCKEALKTRACWKSTTIRFTMLCSNHLAAHHHQCIMGKELQLRQRNFGCFSKHHVFLRESLRHEHAKDILGATCTVLEDKTKMWYVKMPEFVEIDGDQPSIKTPSLHMLEDDVINPSDYLDDPTDPVLCVPEQDHDHYWRLLNSGLESALGGPGSTMNFWQLSAGSERLTLGVKMHSAAAFLSMPISDGAINERLSVEVDPHHTSSDRCCHV